MLPDSKLPSADRITVARLVEVTSGPGDIFGPEFTTVIVLANDEPPIAEKTRQRISQWMAK